MVSVGKAILIDIGGVLIPDRTAEAAGYWSDRLGMSPQALLDALYAGNDDQVLIGRISEPAWWRIVGDRLQVGPDVLAELREDLASRQAWDAALVALLRRLRGQVGTAIVSNAWPQMRASMARAGLADLVDAVILSCEVGWAKPDPGIYLAALARLGADPGGALFVDDSQENVVAAESLGMTGHVHTGTAGTMARIQDFVGLGG
jgi:putative hydrolase of the HAD superfamily